jgi:hypothetical protein
MKRIFFTAGISFALVIATGSTADDGTLQDHSPKREPGLTPSDLSELKRGLTYRFLDDSTIEIKEEWSGVRQIRTLREPGETHVRAWADTQGIPILELNPAFIDTNKYAGWYTYWVEVPSGNSFGNPLMVGDTDGDGNAEVYGGFKGFSTGFEAHVYEVDASSGAVFFLHNYAPRRGISRALTDADRDSLQESIFSLAGTIYDYEQTSQNQIPININFEHERFYLGAQPGFTGIYFGSLDSDNWNDFLYNGSGPDSTDSTRSVTRVFVAEYNAQANNFLRVWSTQFNLGYTAGVGGFSVGDFDGDRKTEFVSSMGLTGKIFVVENTGDDTYAMTWQDSTPFVNLYYHCSGDVDRDGEPEYFVGATMSNGNWTLMYEADSNDCYSPKFLFHLLSGGSLDYPEYLTSDVDGDGWLELVIFSGADLYVFKSNGDNSYVLRYYRREAAREGIQVYDFNDDGMNDFIISKSMVNAQGQLRFYANIYKATELTQVSQPNDRYVLSSVFLAQNYPNPLNPITTINYSLPTRQWAKLAVYDVLGQGIATLVDEEKSSGIHTVVWDASDQPSGVYFCCLQTPTQILTRKMLLIR